MADTKPKPRIFAALDRLGSKPAAPEPPKTTRPASDRRYVVLTVEDAAAIAGALDRSSPDLARIAERLEADTGGNIEEIVDILKRLPHCSACVIEGQEDSCRVHEAQKQGRRLRRLLERARGERAPGRSDPA